MKSRQTKKWYIAGGYIRTGNVYYDARDDYITDRVDWGVTPVNLQAALSEHPHYQLYESPEAAKAAAYQHACKQHKREDSDRNVFTIAEIQPHPNHAKNTDLIARENIIFIRAYCYRVEPLQALESIYDADMFARKSYRKILDKHSGNISDVEGIRFLFNDYAHPRLFSFHLNRHHKAFAENIVDLMPADPENAYQYLLAELEKLKAKGAKHDGSMMRRMQYAISKLGSELTKDLEASRNYIPKA